MPKLEVYFDCSSPWTYLCISNVGAVARRNDVEPIWRPVLVGGIFNQVNQQVYENRENPDRPKYRYMKKDLIDWAAFHGVRINWPSIFPVNAVKGMRACIAALDEGKVEPFALRLCDAYWGDDRDISQDEVIIDVANAVGLDGEAIVRRTAEPEIKERLKRYTQEVVDRGGFGSPTMFVDDTDMFFGNDRLVLLEWALQGKAPGAGRVAG